MVPLLSVILIFPPKRISPAYFLALQLNFHYPKRIQPDNLQMCFWHSHKPLLPWKHGGRQADHQLDFSSLPSLDHQNTKTSSCFKFVKTKLHHAHVTKTWSATIIFLDLPLIQNPSCFYSHTWGSDSIVVSIFVNLQILRQQSVLPTGDGVSTFLHFQTIVESKSQSASFVLLPIMRTIISI